MAFWRKIPPVKDLLDAEAERTRRQTFRQNSLATSSVAGGDAVDPPPAYEAPPVAKPAGDAFADIVLMAQEAARVKRGEEGQAKKEEQADVEAVVVAEPSLVGDPDDPFCPITETRAFPRPLPPPSPSPPALPTPPPSAGRNKSNPSSPQPPPAEVEPPRPQSNQPHPPPLPYSLPPEPQPTSRPTPTPVPTLKVFEAPPPPVQKTLPAPIPPPPPTYVLQSISKDNSKRNSLKSSCLPPEPPRLPEPAPPIPQQRASRRAPRPECELPPPQTYYSSEPIPHPYYPSELAPQTYYPQTPPTPPHSTPPMPYQPKHFPPPPSAPRTHSAPQLPVSSRSLRPPHQARRVSFSSKPAVAEFDYDDESPSDMARFRSPPPSKLGGHPGQNGHRNFDPRYESSDDEDRSDSDSEGESRVSSFVAPRPATPPPRDQPASGARSQRRRSSYDDSDSDDDSDESDASTEKSEGGEEEYSPSAVSVEPYQPPTSRQRVRQEPPVTHSDVSYDGDFLPQPYQEPPALQAYRRATAMDADVRHYDTTHRKPHLPAPSAHHCDVSQAVDSYYSAPVQKSRREEAALVGVYGAPPPQNTMGFARPNAPVAYMPSAPSAPLEESSDEDESQVSSYYQSQASSSLVARHSPAMARSSPSYLPPPPAPAMYQARAPSPSPMYALSTSSPVVQYHSSRDPSPSNSKREKNGGSLLPKSFLGVSLSREGGSTSRSPSPLPGRHPPPLLVDRNRIDPRSFGLTGLSNLANTCYMNSTLQLLSATKDFAEYFVSGTYKNEVNKKNSFGTKGQLAEAVAKLIVAMRSESQPSISPTGFRDAFCRYKSQFKGKEQHDAQEFLNYLLDGLHEDLNLVKGKVAPRDNSPQREAWLESLPEVQGADIEWEDYRNRNDSVVIDYFSGQFRNRMECLFCHQTSTTYNAFSSLSLPIPSTGRSRVTLHECLNEFLREEILSGENAWNCPRCRRPRSTSKRLSLARLPGFFVIHLKRFATYGNFSSKVDTEVMIPIERLELQQYLPRIVPGLQLNIPQQEHATYELYGVCNHHDDGGPSGLASGHYTALVKNSEEWFGVDDEVVRPASQTDVLSATRSAYLLFYRLTED